MLLQMLREHYCGSLTFREQRNMVENLHQKSLESGVDFLIQVGKAIHTLAKDWKGKLTGEEICSLQYEVSMNGVREDIRHVLDTQQVKSEVLLSPHDMYEAVKKYKTYIAHNWRLEGQTRATSHTIFKNPGYKPKFLQLQWTNQRMMPPMRLTSSSLAMRVLRRPPLTMKTKLGYLSLTLWKRWWVETMFSK